MRDRPSIINSFTSLNRAEANNNNNKQTNKQKYVKQRQEGRGVDPDGKRKHRRRGVVVHDVLKWLEELLLELEAGKLVLLEELVGQLLQVVDRVK